MIKPSDCLFKQKKRLLQLLRKIVAERNFRYETFGKDIEDYINDELIEIFTDCELIESESDYHKAKDKNEFPDFALTGTQPFAFEIKSGNRCRIEGNKVKECKNSENDMGTLRDWPAKIKKFGDNIYCIFVEYRFDKKSQEIVDVKVDKIYKFIGLNLDGMLKYREKDGHLRPKNFDDEPKVNSLEEFVRLIGETDKYRSKRIARKHLLNISPDERAELLRETSSLENSE